MIHRYEPPSDSEDKTKRAIIYGSTFIGTYLLFVVGGAASLRWLGIAPGHGVYALLFVFFVLSQFVADWVACRGLTSQASRTQEIIQRNAGAALAPFLSEAPVFDVPHLNGALGRVNREGLVYRPRRVLWRDVESCTFIKSRDFMGRTCPTSIVLQDREGKTLLSIMPFEHQADLLLPAIRFYLRGEELEQAHDLSSEA